MGLVELFEIGFFTALFNYTNIYLSLMVWLCVAVGAVLQHFFQKSSHSFVRWGLPVACIFGVLMCEGTAAVTTGWDRLAVYIIYGLLVCLLLGAGISVLAAYVKNRRKR